MLTVAYCRVSTEEQAAEGFSIAGQADKRRVYAELHDLGAVTVIADPGLGMSTPIGPTVIIRTGPPPLPDPPSVRVF